MRKRMLVAFVALAWLGASTPASAGKGAFLVPEQEFFSRVHTIALLQVDHPADFRESDTLAARVPSVAARVDSLLRHELEAMGFRVLPASDFEAERARLADSLGGIFDPETGAANPERLDLVWKRLGAEFTARGVDAFLAPELVYVSAAFQGGRAVWDGAAEKITSESFGKAFFKGMTFRTMDIQRRGSLPALSLKVAIGDATERTFYLAFGGVQALSRVENGRFQDLPRSEWLQGDERTDAAVRLALSDLARRAQRRAAKS